MAAVVGELYAAEQVCVAFVQIADDAPGVVFGTVVDEQDAALFADPSGFGKMCDFGGQHVGRVHEPFRIVVAGKHRSSSHPHTQFEAVSSRFRPMLMCYR